MDEQRDQRDQRRTEDRDRQLYGRLEAMEREYRMLADQVKGLEAQVGIVKIEQLHLKEFFTAKFVIIEKSQEIVTNKLDHLAESINAMASDPSKTPVGRTLQEAVRSLQEKLDEHADAIESTQSWVSRVDGVLLFVQWMGAAGVGALVLALLMLFKVIKS